MKKKMLIAMAAAMLAVSGMTVSASDLEIQAVNLGMETEAETLSLDDIQMEETYDIPGYMMLQPLSYNVRDHFVQYAAEHAGDNETGSWSHCGGEDGLGYVEERLWSYWDGYDYYYGSIGWQRSGTDADFAWLLMDVTNLMKDPLLIGENTEVKVIYNDEYEFAGWVRQFDYNYDVWRADNYSDGYDEGNFVRAALDPSDEQPISMLYTGHYVFGCTLPNAVIEGEEPLRMVITIGGNEITYHIRK